MNLAVVATTKLTLIRQSTTTEGGAERYLQRLQRSLTQQDIQVEALAVAMPRWLPSWWRALWFNRTCRRYKNINQSNLYFSLSRITCADVYRAGDGVHRVYMQRCHKHFYSNPLHFVYCYLEKRCFQHARHIIANSKLIKQEITASFAIDPDKISVIYNGIEPVSFDEQAAKSTLAERYAISDANKIILFVGNGYQRKGLQQFLNIISGLEANYTAFILGKDKHIEHYQAQVSQLGITQPVYFLGYSDAIQIFYAAADIFILPTHYDPFTNALLEAMAYRCVGFSSRHNGATEILPDGFTTDDSKACIKTLQALLDQPAALATAKQQHFEISKQYSMLRNTQQTLTVITSLLANKCETGRATDKVLY